MTEEFITQEGCIHEYEARYDEETLGEHHTKTYVCEVCVNCGKTQMRKPPVRKGWK